MFRLVDVLGEQSSDLNSEGMAGLSASRYARLRPSGGGLLDVSSNSGPFRPDIRTLVVKEKARGTPQTQAETPTINLIRSRRLYEHVERETADVFAQTEGATRGRKQECETRLVSECINTITKAAFLG